MKCTVAWLGNHGLEISYGRKERRFEGPAGAVTVKEAALALDTNEQMLRRMIWGQRLQHRRQARRTLIPMSEVLRLRRAWKVLGRPTGRLSAAS